MFSALCILAKAKGVVSHAAEKCQKTPGAPRSSHHVFGSMTTTSEIENILFADRRRSEGETTHVAPQKLVFHSLRSTWHNGSEKGGCRLAVSESRKVFAAACKQLHRELGNPSHGLSREGEGELESCGLQLSCVVGRGFSSTMLSWSDLPQVRF